MHSTNFDATISKQSQYKNSSKIIQKSRDSDCFAFMGATQTNIVFDYFNECIGEAKFNGRRILPSTKSCERSERIELLNFLNMIKIGGLQNA